MKFDDQAIRLPAVMEAILRDTEQIGFTMASEPQTGALLRVLAASKPGGRFLELGTGTGVGTAWILEGMDSASLLDTVDKCSSFQEIARRHLGGDLRVTFHLEEGATFLERAQQPYDFIFADAWAGKFDHLELALRLLRPGGIYIVDDLLPQKSWPDGHEAKIPGFIEQLESQRDFISVRLAWASGLMIAVRRSAA
jgi:predicted O-methyltransferase YrrM